MLSLALNTECYSELFKIENILREFCKEQLTLTFGEKWYLSQLSPTAKQKFTGGIAYDRSQFSLRLISFHPIYYLDFPDLREIISRRDNWKSTFTKTFGERDYERLKSLLAELEPVRNSVAHNRPITDHEKQLVRNLLTRLQNWIGQERCDAYLESALHPPAMFSMISDLEAEIRNTSEIMISCSNHFSTECWENCSKQWWWDSAYLDTNLDHINEFYRLAFSYRDLPAGRGSGLRIETWLKANPVVNIADLALGTCGKLRSLGEREQCGSAHV
ncbi:MAG: Swt1 family HEPN domain-containing protein [Rhizomicrobium sp.]